jgi:hypothetical protein
MPRRPLAQISGNTTPRKELSPYQRGLIIVKHQTVLNSARLVQVTAQFLIKFCEDNNITVSASFLSPIQVIFLQPLDVGMFQAYKWLEHTEEDINLIYIVHVLG